MSAGHIAGFTCQAFWGYLGDSRGRVFILLLSLFMGLLSSIIYAFASTFWVALFAQVLDGVFSGSHVLVKSRIGEVSDIEWRAWGYSMYGVTHSVAGFVGPALIPILYVQTDNAYPFATACLAGSAVYIIAFFFTRQVVEGSSRNYEGEHIDVEKSKEEAVQMG
jgi:MFS family permease